MAQHLESLYPLKLLTEFKSLERGLINCVTSELLEVGKLCEFSSPC